MAASLEDTPDQQSHLDVIIVGAGLSGIGAACHLQARCPGKRFLILEARDSMGGTWDLFRYPGVRSDSDMHTLGYAFRPWTHDKAIARGPDILDYIRDTAREHGIDRRIRYGCQVRAVGWNSADARWTVESEQHGMPVTHTCAFLFVCSGYYRYDRAYLPDFPGMADFSGRLIHPQYWTPDIDCRGKQVVVIGSGATAVTLVPDIAQHARQVVMLQRSPSYIMALPSHDLIANWLRRFLPPSAAYALARCKNVLLGMLIYQLSRRTPEHMKRQILRGVQAELGPDYDVASHFTPAYKPWDQRLCLTPDGDFFRAIREGRVEMVTDHV
jgi:monooxygenase